MRVWLGEEEKERIKEEKRKESEGMRLGKRNREGEEDGADL